VRLPSHIYTWLFALCSLPFSTFMPNSAACFAESFAPSISTTFWRQRKREVIRNNPTTRTREESSGRDIYTMENAGRLETIKNEHPAGLRRSVGFYGLMFVSLGSIIGSGWLLGALNAAQVAGPASILSWVLAACMLALLALTYAELGATYPVAGGAARFPYYSHGPIAGFTAGWASWLQAVFIAPIEVLAA